MERSRNSGQSEDASVPFEKMEGQMNLFDFIEPPIKPGDWLEENQIGEEMTFDEIAESVGKVIAIDMSTESRAWYKAVCVEKILEKDEYDGKYRRLIYYDGTRQRGYISEMYFIGGGLRKQKAWRIA